MYFEIHTNFSENTHELSQPPLGNLGYDNRSPIKQNSEKGSQRGFPGPGLFLFRSASGCLTLKKIRDPDRTRIRTFSVPDIPGHNHPSSFNENSVTELGATQNNLLFSLRSKTTDNIFFCVFLRLPN